MQINQLPIPHADAEPEPETGLLPSQATGEILDRSPGAPWTDEQIDALCELPGMHLRIFMVDCYFLCIAMSGNGLPPLPRDRAQDLSRTIQAKVAEVAPPGQTDALLYGLIRRFNRKYSDADLRVSWPLRETS